MLNSREFHDIQIFQENVSRNIHDESKQRLVFHKTLFSNECKLENY